MLASTPSGEAYTFNELKGIFDDAGFAAQLRRYFDQELGDSLRITPAIHRARAGLLRRLKWTISHWLVTAVDYTVTRRLNFSAER